MPTGTVDVGRSLEIDYFRCNGSHNEVNRAAKQASMAAQKTTESKTIAAKTWFIMLTRHASTFTILVMHGDVSSSNSLRPSGELRSSGMSQATLRVAR